MIHECNIHCHAIEIDKADLMGLEDKGKWLPFIFHLSIVIAAKMTTDDSDEVTHNCTSVFTEHGDSYIIDTPYKEFAAMWKKYQLDLPNVEEKDLEL